MIYSAFLKLITLCVLFISGCSSTGDSRVSLGPGGDEVYISNGVEQYYFALLPYWANFSTKAACFRSSPIRYINFEKISKSYNLSYSELIHLQHMINRKLYSYKDAKGQDQLSPKDESFIFQNTYQKVNGGSTDFVLPKYHTVSIIWSDSFDNDFKKIKKVLEREDVLKGYPILVSMCLSDFELNQKLREFDLDTRGIKILSADMFASYDKDLKRIPEFTLDLKEFFKKKKIIFYKSRKRPNPFGDIKTINVK